jgi:hypothetical protein
MQKYMKEKWAKRSNVKKGEEKRIKIAHVLSK